jgi:hypothetical protein
LHQGMIDQAEQCALQRCAVKFTDRRQRVPMPYANAARKA